MTYNIIETGSKGNATVIKNIVLIDCGVPFKRINPFVKDLKLVCLSHQHLDHFNKSTIKRLHKERPTLRFACCDFLLEKLLVLGIKRNQIDVLKFDKIYSYGVVKVIPFELYHDVPNCGYKLIFKDYKAIYATDTSKIETTAKNYDLYLIEANYDTDELQQRIEDKKINGGFIYETKLPNRHLSIQKCNEFLLNNMNENSVYVYMHQHRE